MLTETEVKFDTSKPVVAPKSWKDIEEEQRTIDQLTEENNQLKAKLIAAEEKYKEAQTIVTSHAKRIEALEAELITNKEFLEKMKELLLQKNDAIRELVAERDAALAFEEKYKKSSKEKLFATSFYFSKCLLSSLFLTTLSLSLSLTLTLSHLGR